MEDFEFQNLHDDAILVGEKLALASLCAELLVLKGAGVGNKDQPRYIGRGQYPKIRVRPLLKATPPTTRYNSPSLVFWSEVRTRARVFWFQFCRGTAG